MAEDRDLPGWPKKALVRNVRRHLATYSIFPTGRGTCTHRIWLSTWAWANDVKNSYLNIFRSHWPCVNEIAAQYVFLLLADMKSNNHLKLPHRAMTCNSRIPGIAHQTDPTKMIEEKADG